MGSATDGGLIVAWNLVADGLESREDQGVVNSHVASKDPDVLGLGKVVVGAGVDDGEVGVVSVEDFVVTGGGVLEELNLALSTVEGGSGSGNLNLFGGGVVLSVLHGNSAVEVGAVAGLLAVIRLPRHASITSLLVPDAEVEGGVEVSLKSGGGALARGDVGVGNTNHGEGSDESGLDHSRYVIVYYYIENQVLLFL